VLKLVIYNFKIFYRLSKKNSTNKLLRRLDYKRVLSLNIKLLSILQNKLALLFNKELLTQSERETLNNLILVAQLTKVFTSDAKHSQS